MKHAMSALAIVVLLSACSAPTPETGAPESESHEGHDHQHVAPIGVTVQELKTGQKVFFANLKDGQSITSPFTVEFGVEGMTVGPAGEIVEDQGHHHLLIGHDFVLTGEVVPAGDSTMVHFGKGQTSYEVNLGPGVHKLTMQFANGAHMSFGEQMSATISVNVEPKAKHFGDK